MRENFDIRRMDERDGEEPWTTSRYIGSDGRDDDSDLEIYNENEGIGLNEILEQRIKKVIINKKV